MHSPWLRRSGGLRIRLRILRLRTGKLNCQSPTETEVDFGEYVWHPLEPGAWSLEWTVDSEHTVSISQTKPEIFVANFTIEM